jgi:hypothetical protein
MLPDSSITLHNVKRSMCRIVALPKFFMPQSDQQLVPIPTSVNRIHYLDRPLRYLQYVLDRPKEAEMFEYVHMWKNGSKMKGGVTFLKEWLKGCRTGSRR